MKKQITMGSVFQAGFAAGFKAADDMSDGTGTMVCPETLNLRFELRNKAWLAYVKEIESESASTKETRGDR